MQLILLSGGSGKSLWPLSNDARSKQFLSLLEAPDGGSESMICRIERQIRKSGLDCDITIATNIAQRDPILSQLGGRVDIVTEPERRDTFPAISLTAEWLRLEKGCSLDETVVIMPCDPYTEDGYFDVIASMAKSVDCGTADLVLMGIRPRYDSTSFGYILPQDGIADANGMYHVTRFVEKPSAQSAHDLISQGALWNGGVFALKLGRLCSYVWEYVKEDSFADLRARYCDMPKISFDYEVVEKAENLGVIPFDGQWEDLGTWNALSRRLHSQVIGDVIMGSNVRHATVLNELDMPLLCEGVRDIVVAAGPDGILVCGRDQSDRIKDYVIGLKRRPMYEERRWGTYRVLNYQKYPDGFEELTKTITLNPGCCISYQVHHHRSEVWTVTDGHGLFILDGKAREVGRGDVLDIKVGQLHAIKALDSHLTFIEVQAGAPLVEEDIERFDWPDV